MATSLFQIEKERFQELILEFINKMDDLPNFIDHARTYKLFTRGHRSEITSFRNPDDQKRKTHDFIVKKLPSKSKEFIRALIESEHDILAQKFVPKKTLLKEFKIEFDELENKYQIEAETLQCQIPQFVRKMSSLSTFLDQSRKMKLLTKGNIKKIQSKENPDDQIREMCEIISHKIPEKTDIFLFCLMNSNNGELVKNLLQFDIDEFDFSHLDYPLEKTGVLKVVDVDLQLFNFYLLDAFFTIKSKPDCYVIRWSSVDYTSGKRMLQNCFTFGSALRDIHIFDQSTTELRLSEICSHVVKGKNLQLDTREAKVPLFTKSITRMLGARFQVDTITTGTRTVRVWIHRVPYRDGRKYHYYFDFWVDGLNPPGSTTLECLNSAFPIFFPKERLDDERRWERIKELKMAAEEEEEKI